MIRRLLASVAALALAAAPAAAAINAPVSTAQTPAYTGDTSKAAGSGVTTTNTVKGKTVLPIDGSLPMTGAIQGVLGNAFTATTQGNYTTGGAGLLIQSGPKGYSALISGGLPEYDAIQGITYIAPGSQSIGQGAGIAGYAASDHASTDSGQAFPVGVFGYGRTSKASTNAWGFNSVAEDAPSGSSAGTVQGITLQNEFDFNVYESGTTVFGSNVIGTFLAQPAAAFAYLCQLNTPTNFTWSSCYTSQDTASDSFASIGLAKSGANNATVANNPSQAINIAWLDSSSTRRNAALRFIPGVTNVGNIFDLSGTGVAGFRAPNLFLPNGGVLQSANAANNGAINLVYLDGTNLERIGGGSGGVKLDAGLTAIAGQSTFGNGGFTDPASGTAYDAKFGGPGAGIAVAGASLFNSSLTAGSLNTPGNASVSGNLNMGSGSQLYTTTGLLYIQYSNNTGGVNINGQGGPTSIGGALSIAGITSLSNTNTSTSATTGALQVAGGVGIAKDLFVGGLANIAASLTIAGTNASSTVGSFNLTSSGASMEIGSLTATGTPYLDFHSSGSANDFDARIIASGGTSGTAQKGNLSLNAGSVSINATLQAASLATSGGTVKGTLCVDTSGNVYVKTTTGACL